MTTEADRNDTRRWLAAKDAEIERLRAALRRVHDTAAEMGSDISPEWIIGATAAALGEPNDA